MKKILYPFWVILFFASPVVAQSSGSSLLWKISGNGLSQPSYLFGSFHLMCKEDFKPSKFLRGLVANCGQLYGELDLNDPGLQQNLMSQLRMESMTLESLIGKDSFPFFNHRFHEITQMPLLFLNEVKPFMSTSLLVSNSISCSEKIQPETEFANIARARGIPIKGLETMAEQIAVLNKEPIGVQVNTLKRSIIQFDSLMLMVQKMQEVYRLNDADSLYRFMKEADLEGEFETMILVNRNHKWIPLIQDAIQSKNSFIVVGAGHLGGTEGVVALLRKEGYQLTPLDY